MSSELANLLNTGESETLEFKTPRAPLEALAKEVCGMLNQRGGVVVWGVADDGSVPGVPDSEQRAQALNEYIVQQISPRPLFSVSCHKLKSREVIVVDAPQGADKPYSFQREIWVRVGAATLKATPELATDIVDSSVAQLDRWEREPMAGFAASDCDPEELKRAKRELNDNGRFGADVPASDEELLQRLSLIRHGQLTNAAVVLFARQPMTWIPNVSLRLVTYVVDKSGPMANDTVLQGPAIRVLKDAIATIQHRTGFSSRFERAQVERQDRPAYALFALREGLVNAMVHRDYSIPGGNVRIEMFPAHLTIHNSGKLPQGWTIQDLRKTHGSHPRNPDIARVFYLRGLMEQLGMGTQKLIAACRELGAKSPIWKAERGTVSLTLYRAPEPEASLRLSPRQATFIESSELGATFKVGDYSAVGEVSERQARRELADLERAGLVEKQGKGPATVYVVTRKPVE